LHALYANALYRTSLTTIDQRPIDVELKTVFKALTECNRAIDVRAMTRRVNIRPGQQDACEFLMRILESTNPVFGGFEEHQSKSLNGILETGTTRAPFAVLPITLGDVSTLLQCLREYFSPTDIPNVDFGGGQRFDAKRRCSLVLEELPITFAVQLKRFNAMGKNNNACNIPTNLDMLDICPRDVPIASTFETKYSLGAIIMHGGALNRGHYWTFVRVRVPTSETPNELVWMEFNDERVCTRTASHVLDQARGDGIEDHSAYIVMYHRIDRVDDILRPPWSEPRA